MIIIVISINVILFLFLFLKGSYSIDTNVSGSSNIFEITQHISNTIISHDKELNNNIDHNSLRMKSSNHNDDHNESFHLDISDKAKLLFMEESTHGKTFIFESFDSTEYEHNHHQQQRHQQQPQPLQSSLHFQHNEQQPQQIQQNQQHHSDLVTENNYNIRFNNRRQLMNNIQNNNAPVDKRKSKRKV
jgi:hypothetical protein